jgi:hypothetical protein
MGHAHQVYHGVPQKRSGERVSVVVLRDFGSFCPAPEVEIESYGSPHALSIHFCFQPLHLWVTASPPNLVYRDFSRKYFGTAVLRGAEVITGCRFLGWAPGVESFVSGVRLFECSS